ncbi:MAG: serine hydrolase domain-containing protein, partial [Bacteroidota bacterium]
MGRNHWILIALPILVWGCSTDQEPLQTQNLLGVWSGTLFQTESAWDSAVVQLEGASPELFLYQEGKPENYPLSQQGELLSVRGSGGLRFDAFLPTEQGPLRGVLTHDLWVQSLEFTAKDTRWVAPVTKPEIIDTDYQVFLHFFQDSLGDLQANIQSNKENRELHFLIEKVSLEGNQIAFNITNPRFSISATYKPGEPGLSLAYGNAGGKRTVPLAKLPENQWGGYLPRSRTEPYTYQIPEAAGAWLPTASLAEVGISPSALDFMGEIKKGTYTHIHSVIITKDDKLVLEEYFHGYHRQYLHDIRSAFKSIASLAVGKAMMQQETLTPNSPLLDYYPEYQISDPQKSQINVRHALTMSTGLQLEDEDAMQWEHPDWVQYKLSLPMQHDPGTVYEYSSGGTQLLSGAIQQATNTYLPLFLYQELLLPMGIHQFQMLTSPAGRGYLADNFYLRA